MNDDEIEDHFRRIGSQPGHVAESMRRDPTARFEATGEWQPISTLPRSGQVLVTDDDPDDGDGYGTIELCNCPMLADGRLLNQNSGNYSRPGVWKWWRLVPSRKFNSAS